MDLLPSTAAATSSVELPSLSLLLPFFFSQPPRPKSPNIFLNGYSPSANDDKTTTIRTSRRSFTLFSLFPASISFSPSLSAVPLLSLERYTDEIEGFTLLKPSTWAKMEKAGAAALFEEGKGSNSIGVVVNPVRLSSLKEFGTPEFVAEKLIQAESRKESTKYAKLITVAERLDHGGRPLYEFEYAVDSTRGGMKRIFSAAFVASKKLYLLNIAYSDRPENPLDTDTRMILRQILHSFGSTV
ncbi:psbP domain-containing protein 2, chloroplastic [Phalaenopsis equestris]|uniref:psbP domain-containing protein 2, chloroplastic n=1 Tax=Phalaenopsis equestris TaxID=78828 RepID=UPI0009E60955|nr:psbP domain-containing protein 2, chloroplastic [Phalaenopsis equestris]